MGKQKTRKSLVKRFKVTKSGKVLHRVSFRRHLSVKKSAKTKRQSRRLVTTNKTYAKKIRRVLGR